MCGFGGELRRDGAPDRDALARMHAALAPRGPDGDGHLAATAASGSPTGGWRSSTSPPRGAQPMVDDALGLAVVFNGCIYNHRELRAELERAGHVFASTSDTEVLLKGWREWGEGMLDRLAGMFAFALLRDRQRAGCVLVRDRLGIKPLYLAELPGGGLRFASTLPALLAARRRRHERRPGRAAPLPELALGRARAADDPARRPQARRRRPCWSSSRDGTRARARATGTRRSSATRRADWPARSGGTRCSTRCASRCGGGWSPTSRSACCSPAGSTRA